MITIDVPSTITNEPNALPESHLEKTRAALADAPYPAPCKKALLAFAELMDERRWSQAEAAKRIKHGSRAKSISGASLSQLLSGTYPANPDAITRSIALAVDRERGRALYAERGFARTRLFAAMSELADLAVVTQRIACIHGGLLCGKSAAAQALAAEYRGASAIYFVAPYADTYGAFVRRLARVRGIPLKGSLSDLREAIIASLDASHLLIIDEYHQPVMTYPRTQARRCMEFVREINDTSRCGILLVGSTEGYAVLCDEEGFHRLAAGIHGLDICDPRNDLRPLTDADLSAVVKAFGLPADKARLAQCREIASDHTISRLFDILRIASGQAERHGHALTWSDIDAIRENTLKLAA